MHAIQKHNGKVTDRLFGPDFYRTRSAGQVYADAELFMQIIKLTAEFGTPAAIVSFLFYARPILVKWLDLMKDRSIEIQQGDITVRIQGDNDVDKALSTYQTLISKGKNASEDKGCGAADRT